MTCEHGGPTQVTPLGNKYAYVWYVCLFLFIFTIYFSIRKSKNLIKTKKCQNDLRNLTKDQNYVVYCKNKFVYGTFV